MARMRDTCYLKSMAMKVMVMMIAMMMEAAYEVTSVADARHLLFLEDGHDGDADDNRDDDRGCL